MPKGQSPAAAGESAETTKPKAGERNLSGKQESNETDQSLRAADTAATTPKADEPRQFGTRLGAILSQVEGLPADLLEEEIASAESGTENTEHRTPNAESRTEETAKTAVATEKETPVVTAEAEEEQPVSDEWPDSAKQRVAQEAEKRRKRTEALTTEQTAHGQTKAQLQAAEAKIAQLSAETPVQVAPTESDPLADVQNPQQLVTAVKDYEDLQEFCARYPNGVEGVDLKTGQIVSDYTEDDLKSGKVRNYSAEEIAQMNLKSSRILQKAVPVKRQYFAERAQLDPIARKLYPEVFDENGRLSEDARQIIQQMPSILKFSDGLLNLGRFMFGLRAEQVKLADLRKSPSRTGINGEPVNPKVEAFTKKQPPLAPSAPVNRTAAAPVSRHGNGNVEVEEAENAAIEGGGTDEDIEKLVEAELDRSRSGKRQPAPT